MFEFDRLRLGYAAIHDPVSLVLLQAAVMAMSLNGFEPSAPEAITMTRLHRIGRHQGGLSPRYSVS